MLCAALLVAATAGCASAGTPAPAAAPQEKRLDVPTMDAPRGVRPAGQRLDLVGLEVVGSQACPVVNVGGSQGLLVSTTGSYAVADGMVLEIGGTRVAVSQSFDTVAPQPLDDGYECGGRHWDLALRLVTDSITVVS